MVVNQIRKTRIKKLYNLKLLYTGCSAKDPITLLLSRSTCNFKKKWLIYIFLRSKVAEQQQQQ